MWISKKRLKALENRVAELEKRVQDQPLEKTTASLDKSIKKAIDLISHIPEGQ